jgi:hypothetical protein
MATEKDIQPHRTLVKAVRMADDSHYRQVIGTATTVRNGYVEIEALLVVDRFAIPGAFERHPSRCNTSARLEDVEVIPTHANATFSPTLTEGENAFLRHMSRYGASGYPVTKLGRKWSFDKAFGVGGTPVAYKTKAAAFQAVEAFMRILLDKAAGRLPPSLTSPIGMVLP